MPPYPSRPKNGRTHGGAVPVRRPTRAPLRRSGVSGRRIGGLLLRLIGALTLIGAGAAAGAFAFGAASPINASGDGAPSGPLATSPNGRWYVVELVGPTGESMPLPRDGATLTIDGGRAEGSLGCDAFEGAALRSGAELRIGPLSLPAPDPACGPLDIAAGTALAVALEATERWDPRPDGTIRLSGTERWSILLEPLLSPIEPDALP
jgi:hypothetical protein